MIHIRQKDTETAVGQWMKEQMSAEGPWFSEIMPNVSLASVHECEFDC